MKITDDMKNVIAMQIEEDEVADDRMAKKMIQQE